MHDNDVSTYKLIKVIILQNMTSFCLLMCIRSKHKIKLRIACKISSISSWVVQILKIGPIGNISYDHFEWL